MVNSTCKINDLIANAPVHFTPFTELKKCSEKLIYISTQMTLIFPIQQMFSLYCIADI